MSEINNINRTHRDRSRVWVYFMQLGGDSTRVRCNLCSAELNPKGSTTILWNHLKFKHSISKTTPIEEKHKSSIGTNMTSTRSKRVATTNTTNSITKDQLDFLYYDSSSLGSLKPVPSTSLSKNFISRLNQLSSPVARKLKFWNKKSFQVNQYDPSFKVIYLGNLAMQLWSKDENCLEKPLSTLWNNYLVNMQVEIVMRLTICNSGLKAITRQHGLTQYWSNRLVYCCSHKNYPRIFSWVYRHEGKKMRQELRCHAVFCPSPEKATKMVAMLNQRLAHALQEFRREKKSNGASIITNSESSALQQRLQNIRVVPLRRQILAKGSANFRPPLERSKSAPKLTSILEEDYDFDDLSQDEFEFAESFEDKEDIEEEDDDELAASEIESECDVVESCKDDLDSIHRNRSNSFNITVIEEIGTSSANATGDKSIEKQFEPNDQDLATSFTTGNSAADSSRGSIVLTNDTQLSLGESSKSEEESEGRTKESFTPTAPVVNTLNRKGPRSSANTNTISSSKYHEIDKNSLADSEDSLSPMPHEAKNDSISSMAVSPEVMTRQASEDSVTQEIILSWPKLVIN